MKESPDPLKSLEALIEHFEQNLYALKSPQYNETQVRLEFINPFFSLLGWDMDNRQGYAKAYKDVIHEDAIKVGGYTKAPDYCFRIGGTRKGVLSPFGTRHSPTAMLGCKITLGCGPFHG